MNSEKSQKRILKSGKIEIKKKWKINTTLRGTKIYLINHNAITYFLIKSLTTIKILILKYYFVEYFKY